MSNAQVRFSAYANDAVLYNKNLTDLRRAMEIFEEEF